MNDWSIDIDEIETEYNYCKRKAKEWSDKAVGTRAQIDEEWADKDSKEAQIVDKEFDTVTHSVKVYRLLNKRIEQDAKAEAYDDMADRLHDLLLDNGWEEYREEEARGIREGIDEDEAIEREWFDRRDGR